MQAAINRHQSPQTTAAAIALMRSGGIAHINIDLVYGLPRQTAESLAHTLEQAVALAPDRFAVFGYAHVPWMKRRQALIDDTTLPGAAARAAMAGQVSDALVRAGYVRIGLDHYARPDDALAEAAAAHRLRRNFQGYVAEETPWVVGVGASAISCLPQGFTQNAVSTADYMAALGGGTFATRRGIAWTDGDRLRGDIIGALMCHFAVDLAAVCERHGAAVPPLLAEVPRLHALIDDGMARLEGTRLCVTERGRPLVRSICAAFDRHYTGAEGRHARGV